MMLRSPRCSDRARVHLLSVSCKTCVFPWLVPGVRTPFPRPDVNMSPFTGVASAWDSHPHRRRCISLNGMGLCSLSPYVSTGSPRLRLVLPPEDRGTGAAVLKPRSGPAPTCVLRWRLQGPPDTTARCRKTCSRPTSTRAGDQRQNKGRQSRKA